MPVVWNTFSAHFLMMNRKTISNFIVLTQFTVDGMSSAYLSLREFQFPYQLFQVTLREEIPRTPFCQYVSWRQRREAGGIVKTPDQ